MRILLAMTAALCACSRGATGPVNACGPGTHDEAGTCVVTLRCGPGTHSDGVSCLADPSDAGSSCGAGTHLSGGVCVANPSAVSCGAGTHLDAGTCTADAVALVCVGGTHLEGEHCLPDDVCATGTHDVLGQCVADHADGGAAFEVRLPQQDIVADGISKIPVLAIGTSPDGAPSTASVVLGTTLTGAGTLAPNAFALSTLGSQVFLTPCSASNPGCSGVFQITLALAGAPNAVVARSWPLTLQAPAGVGTAAPCLGGGNVIFFDGDAADYIYQGTTTITQGSWNASATPTQVDTVHVHVTPSNTAQGAWWDLYFRTSSIPQPMAKQVYLNAERWPFEAPGHPGFDVSGDGRGCNTVTGRFQVEDLKTDATGVTSFTATFEHHCEGQTPALRGCVHFGP